LFAQGVTGLTIGSTAALRRLCELRDWPVTNLEANKLLYFAQMIVLGETGRPLVKEKFQAWNLGPVLPAVYHMAKAFGDKPIRRFLFSGSGPLPERYEEVMQETMNEFGELNSARLVAESHWRKGAWAKHYREGSRGIEIPNDDILAEYRARCR
jgi:uncharacterized phage-associated protein